MPPAETWYDVAMDMDQIHTHPRTPAFLIFGGLAVAIGIFIFASLYRPYPPTEPKTRATPITRVVSTPVEFQDFIGTITAVSPALVVKVNLTQRDGTTQTKDYTVATNTDTVIQILRRVDGQASFQPIRKSDLKVDQRVHVYADHNVAEVTELTATKIDQLDI